MQRYLDRVVPRRDLALVAALVLLVDDDEAEPFNRRKHGAAGANHDLCPPEPNAPPLIEPFAGAQPAVQNRDIIRKPRPEPADRLRRERDFRHQHDRLLAGADAALNTAHIDLGFSASGHAVQQKGFACAGVERADNGVNRRTLRFGWHNRAFAGGRFLVRPAKGDMAALHDVSALRQRGNGSGGMRNEGVHIRD